MTPGHTPVSGSKGLQEEEEEEYRLYIYPSLYLQLVQPKRKKEEKKALRVVEGEKGGEMLLWANPLHARPLDEGKRRPQ